MLATVYRAPERNSDGDPIGLDGKVIRIGTDGTEVGVIDGLILGASPVLNINARGHVVSTAGLIGVPADSPVTLRHGDTVVLDDGPKLRIDGPMAWGRPHSLTGTPARYRWWQASGPHN